MTQHEAILHRNRETVTYKQAERRVTALALTHLVPTLCGLYREGQRNTQEEAPGLLEFISEAEFYILLRFDGILYF